MSWVAVAIGGSALLGYLGSQNAASAQQGAANQSNATQWQMYNQTRQDQTPWRTAGGSAINQLGYLMGLYGYAPQGYGQGYGGANAFSGQGIPVGGLNTGWSAGGPSGMRGRFLSGVQQPSMEQMDAGVSGNVTGPMGNALSYGAPSGTQGAGMPSDGSGFNPMMGSYGSLSQPFGMSQFQVDPGYMFRLQQGQQALDRSAASRGMLLSGAQIKASNDYNQGMASQEYQNAYNRYNSDQSNLFNRLAAMSGIGQTSANTLANVGMNTANQVGQNQLGAGNAAAAGWTAGTGALSNALNSWGNYSMWNQMGSPYGNLSTYGTAPSGWTGMTLG